jgi:ribose transport system permease protein
VLLAIAVALLIGAINGLGVVVFRVQPLVMTLGMGLVVAGVLLGGAADRPLRGLRQAARPGQVGSGD